MDNFKFTHYFIISIFIFALISSRTNSQTICNVKAFLKDLKPNGISVYSSPRNKIVNRIIPCSDCDGKHPIIIMASQNGWFKVRWDSSKIGWIHTGSIGVWTKPTIDANPRLFSEPSKSSNVLHPLAPIDQFAQIIKCKNQWAFVRIKLGNTKWISGWLPHENQCAQPHTSCN